ncbi:MAG TPA: cytochrome c [Micropepsaceae bacterium]|jgi:mono/diheme cytochrome c family protein
MTAIFILRPAAGFIAASSAFLLLAIVAAASQPAPPDGHAIFLANCATCHGVDGRGMRTPAEVGFDLPMPNFSDCSFATREADADWSSTIHRGGRQRALARIMPAFEDALSDDEIDAVIGYLRTFCTDPRWVRGEFNFPLGLFTEKAFLEDELVWTTAIDAKSPNNIQSQFILEKRIGATGQLEFTLPFARMDGGPGVGRNFGVGDFGVAWKQNVVADVDSGTIFSVLGEMVLPTGSEKKQLGTGSLSFETHALFAQMLPDDFVYQGQIFAAFPLRKNLVQEVGVNMGIGRTFAEEDGYGRAWTPALELVGRQEMASGAKTDWDIVPQMQVSLSTLQHILVSAGYRIPVTNSSQRSGQFVFYFIWDWYDGGLLDHW